ncbi:phosphotransferase family protein [Baekduia soli]|uniref:Phosphotransferase family protein n=1 Tax=Baekduia soli TaxID=496014 RepID=A0A5B8U6K7_9ACTN|nr:phosphotransferase family protein [Baekduia soli]QEC48733.1 phosphotransferase family protein [Baekduia soli]
MSDDVVEHHEDAAGAARPPLLVIEPLRAFLDAHGLGSGPVHARPIGDGHSNPTFVLTREGAEVVLRRPPRPPLPPSSHDVLRESRVIGALAGRAPVPAILATCEDPAVIGAPFFLMERMAGHVLTDAVPESLAGGEGAIADALVDALVGLHAVDWRACGLQGFGRPAGYLARQVRRFEGLWELSRTRDLPVFGRLATWLGDHLPESPATTIVHGDYRLGNTMYAPQAPPRVVAILDWEMSTLGDPLADVGYLCAFWVQPDDPPLRMFDLSTVTRSGGFPTRAELVARYHERSGRSTGAIAWYQTLALWKLAVAMEGIHRRAVQGGSDDPYLAAFADGVPELLERAAATAGVPSLTPSVRTAHPGDPCS